MQITHSSSGTVLLIELCVLVSYFVVVNEYNYSSTIISCIKFVSD